MNDLLRLLTLQDANTRVVLLGTALLGLAAGVVGAFAVLRRRALVGDALAHASLPGICAAYFVVGDKNFAALLVGALVFGVLGVLCIGLIRAHTRIKEDSAIGLVLSTFFGLGIVWLRQIQNQPSGDRAGLEGFIYGKAASMVRQDVVLIGAVAAGVLLVVTLLYKEFKQVCFDRSFAASQGWPVLLLDFGLMALICVCTVAGLPAVGVVLMAALLIIPGVCARFWTDRLSLMLVIAGAIGMFTGVIGTALSATIPGPSGGLSRGLPTGPLIALTAAACFIVSMLAAPRRGLIADLVRRRRLKGRVRTQNVLRALFEAEEREHAGVGAAQSAGPAAPRSMTGSQWSRELSRAASAGLAIRENGRWYFTSAGREAAARVVRAHRLWELFLIQEADIASDHVDRDADEIEHVLPRDVIERLEEQLRAQGRLPGAYALVPSSPHEVSIGAAPWGGTKERRA